MVLSLLVSVALAGCPEPESVREAAEGGWLMEDQRQCLQKAAVRRRHPAVAAELLLADAHARSDRWAWSTLARQALEQNAADGDLWLQLVMHTHRFGEPSEVVVAANNALDARPAWSTEDDARVAAIMRLRTYAALHARGGPGLPDDVVRYAKEWLEESKDRAPAVAWELAGIEPSGAP